jgi:hypothetical protein
MLYIFNPVVDLSNFITPAIPFHDICCMSNVMSRTKGSLSLQKKKKSVDLALPNLLMVSPTTVQ